jgi:hypothetical protein
MQEINEGFNLDITLKDEDEQKLVVCSLENGGQLHLTLHQARILAIKLITAVGRAEVKHNLKHEDNLSRKAAITPPATGVAGSSF